MVTESESVKFAKRELTEEEEREYQEMLKGLTEEEEEKEQEYQEMLKEMTKYKKVRSDEPTDNEGTSDKEAQTVVSSEDVKSSFSIDALNHYIHEKVNKLVLTYSYKIYMLFLVPIYTLALSTGLYEDNFKHNGPCSLANGCADGFLIIFVSPVVIFLIIVVNVVCYYKLKYMVYDWGKRLCRIMSSKKEFSDILDMAAPKVIRCRTKASFISNYMLKIVRLNIFSLIISFPLSILIILIQIDSNKSFYAGGSYFHASLFVCIFTTLFVLCCLIFPLITNSIKVCHYRKKYQRPN